MTILVTLLVSAAACGDDPEPDTPDSSAADTGSDAGSDAPIVHPPACWDDLAPGESEVFYDGFSDKTEGIAFGPDGRLYVGSKDTVYAMGPDATPEPFASVPSVLGLAGTHDGLVAASMGASNSASELDGGVYHLAMDGTATPIILEQPNPNFVTLMPNGDVLFSDTTVNHISRVSREGALSVLAQGIDSPNGMAYTPDGAGLVVASTFSLDGSVTQLPVDDEGIPQDDGWVAIAELGVGATADGVAIGANGDVYVAANLRNEIVRIPADGSAWEVVGTVRSAASLAFGQGDFDPCSIYVTQLFGPEIIRLSLGQPGAPLYTGAH